MYQNLKSFNKILKKILSSMKNPEHLPSSNYQQICSAVSQTIKKFHKLYQNMLLASPVTKLAFTVKGKTLQD